MSNRLDQEREARLQPKRMARALKELVLAGCEIEEQTDTMILFKHKGNRITYYPYSGWATGKSIQDGRGLRKLLNQLK